jgi:uncharacterized protein
MDTRPDQLNAILKQLQQNTPQIEAAALVSVDGLVIASTLPAGMAEERVAAMSAAMLSLAERITSELERGTFEQVFVRGDSGYVLLLSVGQDAVLTVLVSVEAKFGLILLDAKRTAERLAALV